MPIARTERHLAGLPGRIQALLVLAREQTGLEQLWTLTVASQLLREQLDAYDERLRHLLAAGDRADRLLPGAPVEPGETIDRLADLGEHLGQGLRRLGVTRVDRDAAPAQRDPPG